jgi:hypothetical protein
LDPGHAHAPTDGRQRARAVCGSAVVNRRRPR